MKLQRFAYRIDGVLRLLVGGAFVVAGALKIADPAKFSQDVSNYRLVPHELINLVAIMVPWLEITAGSFVLAGIWLRAAALLIAGMTVVFFALILSALIRGLNIECGCFGTIGGKHVGLVNLAIDSILFFLAALLARRSNLSRKTNIFREAGAQNTALPLEASPKAGSAPPSEGLVGSCVVTLQGKCRNQPYGRPKAVTGQIKFSHPPLESKMGIRGGINLRRRKFSVPKNHPS